MMNIILISRRRRHGSGSVCRETGGQQIESIPHSLQKNRGCAEIEWIVSKNRAT